MFLNEKQLTRINDKFCFIFYQIRDLKGQMEEVACKLKSSQQQHNSGVLEGEQLASELSDVQDKFQQEKFKNTKLKEKVCSYTVITISNQITKSLACKRRVDSGFMET